MKPEKTSMDRLTDPIRLCRRVFAGQEERIPLIVSPPCGPLPKAAEYETDTAAAVRRAAAAVQPMDAFLAREPVRGVPRRGGRGLVLHTHAASVDAAKQLYAAWQQRVR